MHNSYPQSDNYEQIEQDIRSNQMIMENAAFQPFDPRVKGGLAEAYGASPRQLQAPEAPAADFGNGGMVEAFHQAYADEQAAANTPETTETERKLSPFEQVLRTAHDKFTHPTVVPTMSQLENMKMLAQNFTRLPDGTYVKESGEVVDTRLAHLTETTADPQTRIMSPEDSLATNRLLRRKDALGVDDLDENQRAEYDTLASQHADLMAETGGSDTWNMDNYRTYLHDSFELSKDLVQKYSPDEQSQDAEVIDLAAWRENRQVTHVDVGAVEDTPEAGSSEAAQPVSPDNQPGAEAAPQSEDTEIGQLLQAMSPEANQELVGILRDMIHKATLEPIADPSKKGMRARLKRMMQGAGRIRASIKENEGYIATKKAVKNSASKNFDRIGNYAARTMKKLVETGARKEARQLRLASVGRVAGGLALVTFAAISPNSVGEMHIQTPHEVAPKVVPKHDAGSRFLVEHLTQRGDTISNHAANLFHNRGYDAKYSSVTDLVHDIEKVNHLSATDVSHMPVHAAFKVPKLK